MGVQQLNESSIVTEVPSVLAAAHELKSPLVLIRQLALQLEESPDSVSLERIKLTAERSLRLVESLTRSSRLDDALFECEPVSINALYTDVAHELYPLATALGQSIHVTMPSKNLIVVGNQTLLRSVLLGLCDNALSHNDANQPVVLSARRSGQMINAEVRDHGPDSQSLARIKRSIGRRPTPLSGRPRSSGLGLLIASQFAEYMQAELTLTRHHKGGATFGLRVPESGQLSLLGRVT